MTASLNSTLQSVCVIGLVLFCLTGHATAEDLVQHFNSGVINRGLTINNMVEISMDGPNVNREFFDKMKVNLRENLTQVCSILNPVVSMQWTTVSRLEW